MNEDPKQQAVSRSVNIASQQLEACFKSKETRLAKILEYEQAYLGKFKPRLKGRSDIPLPFFSKYVDELKARLDDAPEIKFKHRKNSQIMVAHKMQSLAEQQKSPSVSDWARIDRIGRSQSIFAGVAAYDTFPIVENGVFRQHLEYIDINDFMFEPTGGSNSEEHAFLGKINVFLTKSQLEKGVEEGRYRADGVRRILAGGGGAEQKETQKRYMNRYERYKAMGIDLTRDNFIGEPVYPFAVWEMMFEGKRMLLVFEMMTNIPIRFEPLKDAFGSDLYTITFWQTHEDGHNVMCKSPADDIWPIAEWMRVAGNYYMDHWTKRIWGQRAVDPNFFPDMSQLEWTRPDQVILAKSFQNKPIGQGVYEFRTEDQTTGTINMINYFETLAASVAGVAPNEASQSQEKVGVLFGNLQKASARLGVYNKSYNENWNKIALRLVHGAKEFIDEPMMVKIIGESGIEWDELKKEELTSDVQFDMEVVGSNVEIEMNEAKKKMQKETLDAVTSDPDYKKELNAKVVVEERMRIAGFSEDSIRRIMDVKHYGSEKIISRAAMALEEMIQGKTPDVYLGADITFQQYIYDFVLDNEIKKPQVVEAIIAYARAHDQIVVRNMTMKAMIELSSQGVNPNQVGMVQPPASPGPANTAVPPNPSLPGAPISLNPAPARDPAVPMMR